MPHRIDAESLSAVVLIQEVIRWIARVLPKHGMPLWSTDSWISGDMDLRGVWARLLTSWIADQVGGPFKRAFDELNKG